MGKKKEKLVIYGFSEEKLALCWGVTGQRQTLVCPVEGLESVLAKQHLQQAEVVLLPPEHLSKWKLIHLPMASREEQQQMVAMDLEKSHDFQEPLCFAWQVIAQDLDAKEELVSAVYCLQSQLKPWLAICTDLGLHPKQIITPAEALVTGINQGLLVASPQQEWPSHYGVLYVAENQVNLIFVHQNRAIYVQVCTLDQGLEQVCLDYNKWASALARQYQLPKSTHCYLLAPNQDDATQEAMLKQIACVTTQKTVRLREAKDEHLGVFVAIIGALTLDTPKLNLVGKKTNPAVVDRLAIMRNLNYVLILLGGLSLAWLASWGYLNHQDQELSKALNHIRVADTQLSETTVTPKRSYYGKILETIAMQMPDELQLQRIATTDFGLRLTGTGRNFEAIGAFGLALENSGQFSAVLVAKAQMSKKIQSEEEESLDFVLDLYIDQPRRDEQ